MLKISFAGCLGPSPVISTQFTLEMCVAATNREKITKTPYFEVQGRSRSVVQQIHNESKRVESERWASRPRPAGSKT